MSDRERQERGGGKKVDPERIVALYAEGLTAVEIAKRTGYSESTVRNYRRAKRCECGALICTSDGPQHEQCAVCKAEAEHAAQYWTRDRIIAAIRRWAEEHGRPPSSTDWNRAGSYWPGKSNVYIGDAAPNAPFAKWADAIEAAGFQRPLVGSYQRTPETFANASRSQLRRRARERAAA